MLISRPCRARCRWTPQRRAAGAPSSDLPVFGCRGCGSQWDRDEQWTPVDADGRVSPLVVAEAARRATRPGTATEAGSTSGPGAAAAGTAGS